MIKMIVAVDRDNAIGWSTGDLPWHIKEDMQRFKELTTGSTVLMGRKTFDSLKRPTGLPNRKNIVLSRSGLHMKTDTVEFFRDPDPLRTYCQVHQAFLGHRDVEPDLWIIGGAQIYNEALDRQLVDKIFVTVVGTHSGADVKLSHNLSNWLQFRLDQHDVGVEWTLADSEMPSKTADGLEYQFMTLRKLKQK